MPNHIHIIIVLANPDFGVLGPSRPTAFIPSIISAFKKFTNKEIGFDIWQPRFNDYIICNEEDYQKHWRYIDENPIKWLMDEYYCNNG